MQKVCSASDNKPVLRLGDRRTFPKRTDIIQNEWRTEKYSDSIPSDQYFICTLDLHDKLVFKSKEKKHTLGDCLKACIHGWNYEEILRKKAADEQKEKERETQLLAFSKEAGHCFPKTMMVYKRGKRLAPRCEDCERSHQKDMARQAILKEEEKERKRQREEVISRITRLSPKKAFKQELDNQYVTAKKVWDDSLRECRECLEKFSSDQQADMDKHDNLMQKLAAIEAKRATLKHKDTNPLEGFFISAGQTADAIKSVTSAHFYRSYVSSVRQYNPGKPKLC